MSYNVSFDMTLNYNEIYVTAIGQYLNKHISKLYVKHELGMFLRSYLEYSKITRNYII